MSPAKAEAARRNLLLAAEANARRRTFAVWRCATCSKEAPATAHQLRQTYCSKDCMAAGYRSRLTGTANPNYRSAGNRKCEVCDVSFHSYQKSRRFCSLRCRDTGGFPLRTSAKKDANHGAVVAALEKGGAHVLDLSRAMFGVPDLLVWHFERWHLIEVKNPKTSYGKRGLNKAQKDWATEWQGGPVYIIRADADVENFLSGRHEQVEQVGGYVAPQVVA